MKRKVGGTTYGTRLVCAAQANQPPPAWPGRAFPEPGRDYSRDGPKPISIVGSTGSIGTQVKKEKKI